MILRCSAGHVSKSIVHFSVVCLVIWPLNGSEAGGDFRKYAYEFLNFILHLKLKNNIRIQNRASVFNL